MKPWLKLRQTCLQLVNVIPCLSQTINSFTYPAIVLTRARGKDVIFSAIRRQANKTVGFIKMDTFDEFRNKTHEYNSSLLTNNSILPIHTSKIMEYIEMDTSHEFRNRTYESTSSLLILTNTSILPLATSGITTSTLAISLATQAFSVICDELTLILPTGCIPTPHQMIVNEQYTKLIQYTKESDSYFCRNKLGKAQKLLTDKNSTDVAMQLSNAVTFDLVGISGASGPGGESRVEALRYWHQLKGTWRSFWSWRVQLMWRKRMSLYRKIIKARLIAKCYMGID